MRYVGVVYSHCDPPYCPVVFPFFFKETEHVHDRSERNRRWAGLPLALELALIFELGLSQVSIGVVLGIRVWVRCLGLS